MAVDSLNNPAPGDGEITLLAKILNRLGVLEGVSGGSSGPDLGYTPEDVANKDATVTLGDSDVKYPTQKAVKSYVLAGLAALSDKVAKAGDVMTGQLEIYKSNTDSDRSHLSAAHLVLRNSEGATPQTSLNFVIDVDGNPGTPASQAAIRADIGTLNYEADSTHNWFTNAGGLGMSLDNSGLILPHGAIQIGGQYVGVGTGTGAATSNPVDGYFDLTINGITFHVATISSP